MMKTKVIVMCLVMAVLAIGSTAQATLTIRDNPGYVPSTGLMLGDWTTVWSDVEGYAITEAFQINLEYQAGILNADIDAFNAYDPYGNWDLNFSDNDDYVFNINLAGGLTIYEYADLVETVGGSNIKWTLTGWHQTILAGDIVGNELVVVPTTTYRPFVGDPPVNDVEIFSGQLAEEIIAYTFTGAAGDIGSGSVLGVQNVPEPATLCLLGLGGLGLLRRRKRA